MSENTFKIRINIQQPPQQAIEEIYPELTEPEVEYQHSWDWKKIAVALSLLLFIVALIGIMVFSGTENESSSTKQQNATTPFNQAPTSQENSLTREKSISELVTKDQSTAIQTHALPESDHSTITTQPAVTQSEKAIHSSDAIDTSSIKPTPESKVRKPIIVPRKKPATPLQSKKPQKTSDFPQVLRAQLSHAIKAREPIDDIDTIQLQRNESKPIYFYLHLKDLEKKKITILWYRNDELDSQLSLHIHNNNWRTNASKQLDHQRLGTWRVELVDESGNLLVTRHFTVTQL